MEQREDPCVEATINELLKKTENGTFFGYPDSEIRTEMQRVYEMADPQQKTRLDEFYQTYTENYRKYLEFLEKRDSSYLQDKLDQDEKICELWEEYEEEKKTLEENRMKYNNVFPGLFFFTLLPLLLWMLERYFLKWGWWYVMPMHMLMLLVPLVLCTTISCIVGRGEYKSTRAIGNEICSGLLPALFLYFLLAYLFYRYARTYLPEIRIGFMLYGIKKLIFAGAVVAIIVCLCINLLLAAAVLLGSGVVIGFIEWCVPTQLPELNVMRQISAPWMKYSLIVILLTSALTLFFVIRRKSGEKERKERYLSVKKAYGAYCSRRAELIREEIEKYAPYIAEQYLDPWIEKMNQIMF